MNEIKINEGKPYDQLTAEEKKQIVGFTDEEHTRLKSQYGNRLKMVTVQLDDNERHDFLVVRPTKDLILAVAAKGNNISEANELMLNTCVKAGDREALEDGAVYSVVISSISQMIKAQAAFMNPA